MKKWQESRNYRQIRNQNGEIIANIITVDGTDVEVRRMSIRHTHRRIGGNATFWRSVRWEEPFSGRDGGG